MGIENLMSDELICLDLQATDKKSAINELADLFEAEQRLKNKKKYIKAVMKREAESTTGIGMGVAIPHGKSKGVTEPSLAFGRCQSGIDYDSLDGNPVHLMFLIAVPENSNDEHLKILSQLSRKLMHEEVREKLLNAQTTDEIYNILGA
ncbi:PTS sugar transporter subunit IIA [Oceanobacillus jeddahense]|uniref:PTS sugar transporter subunit IIA n=1 Tax=Oceanobacillus jeddahense TaxID=1462527 RepID=A0ABY5JR92_9BACI|nr:PTS sugar transporter subunit IIA [Oceanobacillus jeddahense]UUI02320.1 PTS sugar transporter subunit IIA [Oceanobacillus jeddahense]